MDSIKPFGLRPVQIRRLEKKAKGIYGPLVFAQTDRIVHKWTQYFSVYDQYFARFRNQPVKLLELGVRFGGSLQIWRQFFGPDATIHGLDIDPRCAEVEEPGIRVHIGSQTDTTLLDDIIDEMGGVDIVLDDASHVCENQIATFEHLYPKLPDDGLYVCEDTHTSYWKSFGGGLKKTGGKSGNFGKSRASFIEYAKNRADHLHSWYYDEALGEHDLEFALMTRSIHFFDSIVIFERSAEGRPAHFRSGGVRFHESG